MNKHDDEIKLDSCNSWLISIQQINLDSDFQFL